MAAPSAIVRSGSETTTGRASSLASTCATDHQDPIHIGHGHIHDAQAPIDQRQRTANVLIAQLTRIGVPTTGHEIVRTCAVTPHNSAVQAGDRESACAPSDGARFARARLFARYGTVEVNASDGPGVDDNRPRSERSGAGAISSRVVRDYFAALLSSVLLSTDTTL